MFIPDLETKNLALLNQSLDIFVIINQQSFDHVHNHNGPCNLRPAYSSSPRDDPNIYSNSSLATMVSLRFQTSRPSDRDVGEPATSEEFDASPTARSPKAITNTEPTNATHRTQPPPPYETSMVSTTPQHSKPSQHQSNGPARKTWVRAQSRATVSTLPLKGPAHGRSYISDCEAYIVRGPEPAARSSLSRGRRLASDMYAAITKTWTWTRARPPASFYSHESSLEIPIKIVNGIQPGEIERPITCYDWTAGWEWTVTLQWGDFANRSWWAWSSVYLNDLPGLLRESHPWRHAQQENAGLLEQHKISSRQFVRQWKFNEPGGRWSGNIEIGHDDYTAVQDIDDPWAFPSPGSLAR